MPEAQCLIERFSLKRVESESTLFPVYESADQSVGLVISGIGKVNAAAATACLAMSSANVGRPAKGWINFGIAGCGDAVYGAPFLGGKVTDGATDRSWYPIPTWPKKTDLPRRPILSIDRPSDVYPKDGTLLEMEAAGFYPTALRTASVELVQVIKVVSDDPAHEISEINKEVVRSLCDEALAMTEPWLEAFLDLIGSESERLGDPHRMEKWTERYRFSVTQTHQLRRLLWEWVALSGGEGLEPCPSIEQPKAALEEIRRKLSAVRRKISI